MKTKNYTHAEWIAEGERRFGPDQMDWAFICPSCGHRQTARDYENAGAPSIAVAFSCVGRWTGADDAKTFKRKGGPCTYAGGGLFALNPVHVDMPDGTRMDVFDFAPE